MLSQSRVLRNGQGRDKVVSVARRGGAGGESGGRAGGRGKDDLTVWVCRGTRQRLERVCRIAREAALSTCLGQVL